MLKADESRNGDEKPISLMKLGRKWCYVSMLPLALQSINQFYALGVSLRMDGESVAVKKI